MSAVYLPGSWWDRWCWFVWAIGRACGTAETGPSTQPAQGGRRAFAELGTIGARHAADMGEAEIERLGSLRLQPGPRPPQRRRLGFDPPVEDIGEVARTMVLAAE